jgi:hypothetical protein
VNISMNYDHKKSVVAPMVFDNQMKRLTFRFADDTHAKLSATGKRFGITQEELINLMVEQSDWESLLAVFANYSIEKEKQKQRRKATEAAILTLDDNVLEKLERMSPEQIAAIVLEFDKRN